MIDKLWYQPTKLIYLLLPFSGLFRCIVALRRLLYRWGIKKKTRFSQPVIVVGNITVGGTGKTPLVIWLVDYLQTQGYRPGVVSRGYRGSANRYPQSVTVGSDLKQVGDEAVLLANRIQCPIVIAADRVAAAKKLLQDHDCNIVISDDGLQHYALERDLEIVVVDGQRRFGNQHCFPAGPLREPLSRLEQVDLVVANGGGQVGWVEMELIPNEIYNIAIPSQKLSWAAACQLNWHAVAGIGHPERFFCQLEQLGLKIQRHPFADHCDFSRSDIDFDDASYVIMTEKDAVKCVQFADQRHWCLPVSAKLPKTFDTEILRQIDQGEADVIN